MSGEPKSSRPSPISWGRLSRKPRKPTDPRGGRHVLRQIRNLSDRLALEKGLDASRIQSVVVGTPAVVDPATGALSLIPNISGLSELSVTRTLAEHSDQEVAVENDVNLAVLGEAWQGCALGFQNAAFLALGTGVGLGMIYVQTSELVVRVRRRAPRPVHVAAVDMCGRTHAAAVVKQANAALPDLRVLSLYGRSENLVTTTCSVTDEVSHALTSDGRTIPGSEVKIVDDNGTKCLAVPRATSPTAAPPT